VWFQVIYRRKYSAKIVAVKTNRKKTYDYNTPLGLDCRQAGSGVKIRKVKDVLPSPFYSGTYHPPDFRDSLAA
jgi:hypothetical protein